MRSLFVLLIFGITCACSVDATKTPAQQFQAIHWLVGNWAYTKGDKVYAEKWQRIGEKYIGYGSITANGQVKFEENLSIAVLNDTLVFQATVPSQNGGQTISFKLTALGERSFTFENLQHDFPQQIRYSLTNKNELTTRVKGVEEGKEVMRSAVYFAASK
ncbi:MAG: DUF6265 family protein [Flammeovirgaceae bacterium]